MANKTIGSSNPLMTFESDLSVSLYTAIITAALTGITLVIAFCTPPLSGPFCRTGCFSYPFLDIASRFPRDYLWMYPAILATASYLVLIVCINNMALKQHKIFSQSGLAFATISSAILILDYFLQISVIQPSILNGEADGISLLSQYNPHGLFIALEEIVFIMMSTSFLCIAPIFTLKKIERAIRWILVIAFITTTIAFLLFMLFLGVNREYYFEITAISINWLALITVSILLSIVLIRKNRKSV